MNRIAQISIVWLILSGLLAPSNAVASPAAPQISVAPSSAAPGALVQIKGTGFNPNGVPRVYWDTNDTQQPFLAQGQTNADGSFVINVAVPPDATVAPHTWWVVNTLRAGGNEMASAPFTVTYPSHSAVYIYNIDLDEAQHYQTLLDARGVHVSLKSLSSITSASNFTVYELIIIGYDTSLTPSSWGNATQQNAVNLSGKPVLGLGRGGFAYFGAIGSPIGYPSGTQASGTDSVAAVNPADPIFNTPYKIALTNGQVQAYSVLASPYEIPVQQPDSQVYPFGSVPATTQMDIIQSGKNLLWGFNTIPTSLTSDGIKLFTNTVYYLIGAMKKDTLLLSNHSRMTSIGYPSGDVVSLVNKLTELVGLSASTTNMNAEWRDLPGEAPAEVGAAYSAWSNLSSPTQTNNLVAAIDGYIEQLKQAAYPNLRYVILVGSHEVIPMKVRPADNYVENDWNIPAGYLYDLYHSGANGSYLTDSVYGDLSYYNNGLGADNELLPELAVGRLVETPPQIVGLINAYIESGGLLSRSNLVSIGSYDFMDGAQAAADAMGASADTSLIQPSFSSSSVPPKLNAKHSVVYIGGHGNYNWMTTTLGSQGFVAGSDSNQGDTEELIDLPNAVIVAAGCHNGVNFTNQLYHNYNGTTTYGDFPERLANKKAGIFLGSTGYTWITLSGTNKYGTDLSGTSERLDSLFVNRLLNYGSKTAGNAFIAAINAYIAEKPSLKAEDRRVVAITTLFGIPNYHWQLVFRPNLVKTSYSIKSIFLPQQPQAANTALQVTATVKNWSISNGVVQIDGAAYYGNENFPILPTISTGWLVPGLATNVSVSLDAQDSTAVSITNDVPNATMGTTIDPERGSTYQQPQTIFLTGLYPDPVAYSYTTSSLDGMNTWLGMSIVPVQYDPSTHRTIIWTKLVFNVAYTGDASQAAIDGDGDGLPDYWENGYGMDPSSGVGDNGAGGDPDQDGLTNQQEFQRGTDPLNADTDQDGAVDGLEVRVHADPLDPGSTPVQVALPAIRR
jgi:hypothetical protein